jgi:hypothetical protein
LGIILEHLFRFVKGGGNCGGGCWWCQIVDSIGANQAPVGISMAMDQQSQPIIAYEDSSNALGATRLKTARPISAMNMAWANCGETPP